MNPCGYQLRRHSRKSFGEYFVRHGKRCLYWGPIPGGPFESAKNGTLFLDEIDSMSLAMQAKLLRVLQEKICASPGGKREIPVTCRVISATNINIDHALETKKIRLDLYYRLSSVVLQIPPLRKRNKDVLLLAQEFINRFQDIFGTHVKGLSSEVADMFLNYDWPGNVRELEHVIEGAMMVVGNTMRRFAPAIFRNGFTETGTLTEWIFPKRAAILIWRGKPRSLNGGSFKRSCGKTEVTSLPLRNLSIFTGMFCTVK